MTLDEAIKHAEEVADTCEYEASKYDMSDSYERHVACQEGKCADEHRQLAEWLKELKQLREQTRWIPVSERLPEANIYDGHDPVWKHEILITGYLSFDDKKETFVNMAFAEDVRNKCVPNTNVTAWMPLPKSYREVKV